MISERRRYAGNVEREGYINGYEYVDLELTGILSGMVFAKNNVNATSESGAGSYYQFGATASYQNTDQSYTDSETLPASRDIATLKMKAPWRMPTKDEMNALINQTSCKSATINGVEGFKLYKTINGEERYIFFPKAYYYYNGNKIISSSGKEVVYWTSTKKYYLVFTVNYGYCYVSVKDGLDKKCGLPVKAICNLNDL